MRDFRNKMREKMALLRMDEGFAARYVNDGFSGGEKKRLEMLQMAVLEPEMAILDETDSGLDIDALRIVAEGVNAMLNPNLGVLLITHYQRLLNYITPDVVHVLAAGPDRQVRRQGPGAPARGRGLRPDPARGRPRRPTCPTRRCSSRRRRGRRARARGGRPLAGPTPMTLTSEPKPSGGRSARPRPARAPRRLPDPRAGDQRPPAGLPRLGVDVSQKPRVVIDAVADYYREYNANVHRGIYTIGEKATAEYEKARARVAALHQRARQPRGRLHPQRDRGDQPRRLLVGPPEHRPRRRDRPDRDGAPRQPRPVAAPRPGEGRRPRVHPDHRRRDPPPRRLRGAAAAQAEARRVHPRLEHARARSTRSARWSRWPTRPARSC